jgi:hypothetical protein
MSKSGGIVQSQKVNSPHAKCCCAIEELVGLDPLTEWAGYQCPMEVYLDVLVVREERGMSKACRESRPWLSISASEARSGQYLKGVAPSRVANEQVDVAKRSQRRIGIYTMGEGRSLEHDGIHSSGFECP